MKKKLAIMCMLFMLTGCSSNQDNTMHVTEIDSMQERLGNLEGLIGADYVSTLLNDFNGDYYLEGYLEIDADILADYKEKYDWSEYKVSIDENGKVDAALSSGLDVRTYYYSEEFQEDVTTKAGDWLILLTDDDRLYFEFMTI